MFYYILEQHIYFEVYTYLEISAGFQGKYCKFDSTCPRSDKGKRLMKSELQVTWTPSSSSGSSCSRFA